MKQLFIASLLVGLTAPAYAAGETSQMIKVSYKGKGISQIRTVEKADAPQAPSFRPGRYVKR